MRLVDKINSVYWGSNNSKSNEIIDYDDLQKSILLVNDRSGVKVSKAEISPGDEFGTSNFDIQTVNTARADGYLIFDNYGSRYTGEYRGQLLTNINSLAKVGAKYTNTSIIQTFARADGYLIFDNYGSRYTGEYRGQLLTNINSLAKVGAKYTNTSIIQTF